MSGHSHAVDRAESPLVCRDAAILSDDRWHIPEFIFSLTTAIARLDDDVPTASTCRHGGSFPRTRRAMRRLRYDTRFRETRIQMRHLMVASALGTFTERIEQYFSLRGYHVDIVHDGVECIEAAQQTPPHALVLDWDLPWGGGAGVLACLRETTATASIPVVLLTETFSGKLDLLSPVVRCLLKSGCVEMLFDSVDSVLSRLQVHADRRESMELA